MYDYLQIIRARMDIREGEALVTSTWPALPPEARDNCPLMRCMVDVLISIKEANNKEIIHELGVLPCSDLACPCRIVRKK